MAFVPIEVVTIGKVSQDLVKRVLSIANSVQHEFVFLELPDNEADGFRRHTYKRIDAPKLLTELNETRAQLRGYHPFLISIVNASLDKPPNLTNLFGLHRADQGLGVFTVADVPGSIVPKTRLDAYLLYYIARYTMSFMAPSQKNHDDTRGCIFDMKYEKSDILKSMKEQAICDECRGKLLESSAHVSGAQFAALEQMLATAGKLLTGSAETRLQISTLPEICHSLVVDRRSLPTYRAASQLRECLSSISATKTRMFVEEAILCLEFGMYRAAVVLSWMGAVSMLYDHIIDKHLEDFNEVAPRHDRDWKSARNADGLSMMKEQQFLNVIAAISVIGKNVKQQLNECLNLRNACGHPNSLNIGMGKAVSHIEILILNVFTQFPFGNRAQMEPLS